jgi:hypothetical protein
VRESTLTMRPCARLRVAARAADWNVPLTFGVSPT